MDLFDISTAKSAPMLRCYGPLPLECASCHDGVHFFPLICPGGSAPFAFASLLFDSTEPPTSQETHSVSRPLYFVPYWHLLFVGERCVCRLCDSVVRQLREQVACQSIACERVVYVRELWKRTWKENDDAAAPDALQEETRTSNASGHHCRDLTQESPGEPQHMKLWARCAARRCLGLTQYLR